MLSLIRRLLEGRLANSSRHRQLAPNDKRPRWELIGTKAYGDVDFERVPSWVQKQIAQLYRNGTSSLGLQTFELKGKTYRYRLAFAGQGGPFLNVYRRRRLQAVPTQGEEATTSEGNADRPVS